MILLFMQQKQTEMTHLLTSKNKKPYVHRVSMYRLSPHSDAQIRGLRQELTLRPRQSVYASTIAEPIECLWEGDDGDLFVPRFFGVGRFGRVCDVSNGQPMSSDAVFLGQLRVGTQVEAHATCVNELQQPGLRGGMLVLPCGMGKTVVAIRIAFTMGRRTVVVVHQDFLMQQWTKAIEMFVPGARIGRIQQDCIDTDDKDIVLAMIQSVASRQYDPQVLGSFGLAIFDECHHLGAAFYNRAIRAFPARCVLGLSATPDRKDGLGPLLAWSLGPILFRAQRAAMEVRVAVLRYIGGAEKEYRGADHKYLIARMQTMLCVEACRNAVIVREVAALFAAGRHTIVLSDRLDQLRAIRLGLLASRVPVAQVADYVGSTKPADRMTAELCDVILSTYTMGREGLDIPRLDTLVMASPIGSVEQAVGRIQRGGADTQVPLIVDMCDPFGPFEGTYRSRRRHYKKCGFQITELQVTAGIHCQPVAWKVGANKIRLPVVQSATRKRALFKRKICE
jgi:superfamily II DNA or RNA helicase